MISVLLTGCGVARSPFDIAWCCGCVMLAMTCVRCVVDLVLYALMQACDRCFGVLCDMILDSINDI